MSFADTKQYDAVLLATLEEGIHPPQVLAAMQPIVGLRSKDPVLCRRLLWFWLFAAFLLTFVIVLANLINEPFKALLTRDLGIVIGGYCLYCTQDHLCH